MPDQRARGREYFVFDDSHADRIIDLVLRSQASASKETLWVNCAAGVARSGAIVTFVAEVLRLDEASFSALNRGIDPSEHVLNVLRGRWRARGLDTSS